jgi:DNA topoisomerase-1
MTKNLVIVESPAKAKTIEKFLGKDYIVRSCFGHIRDLPKDSNAVDIKNGYKPFYKVPDDKKTVVKDLKKLANASEMVWLASDEDREGEAISWHLTEELGLKENKTKRIVFHEITKNAILAAIENPRGIDMNLVNAQQARRVLDRIVGFELSPVLWKKVRPSLSAGRVQSVAVRLIVEREREITSFNITTYYKVKAEFKVKDKTLVAEVPGRFDTDKEVEAFLNSCINAVFTVSDVEVKPATRKPAPPFTTSTLQQEAGRKLGYSVSRTMTIAQKLYEDGHITYMRTDSVNLSDFALAAAKMQISGQFGNHYSKVRKYTTEISGAQEAHEAIRPTAFEKLKAGADEGQKKLYDLIWKRTIASQMAEAKLEKTVITISNSKNKESFVAEGEVIKFDGFLKVNIESSDDDDENQSSGLLPVVNKGDVLPCNHITATQKYTRPLPRYTESSLVKKMEELGIGRPSTYAPTITTIMKRGYVLKDKREGEIRSFKVYNLKGDKLSSAMKSETVGAEKDKLTPSDIGKLVTDFLQEHFGQIMDYHFTANVEKEFDEIAQGLKLWTNMIDAFYLPFHQEVDKTIANVEKVTGVRELGIDPKSGQPVFVKIGKFGPMVQIGETSDDNKPRFARLQKGQSLDDITLAQAMKLFDLPKVLGDFEEKPARVGLGKFGPYIQHDNKFISLGKDDDPYKISFERAVELIVQKRDSDVLKRIKSFEEDANMLVLNGRFGPYISFNKANYRIPKTQSPSDLSYAECLEIIEKQPAPKTAKKSR